MSTRSAARAQGPKSGSKQRTSTGASPQSRHSPRKTRKSIVKAQSDASSADDGSDFGAEEGENEGSLDSDNLDDDSDADVGGRSKVKKRKRASQSPVKKPSPRKASPKKRKKKADSDEDDVELEEGQEIVGVVVQAPKTGRVPPGRISQNTLDFLTQLKKPECNDREWFKLHEPVYRLAEKEWKDFIEEFTSLLTEEDSQIPPLPPKDVIHRIYRDVRFSNDKTPYKTGFSASFSRSGRKGIFAHLIPGGESLVAAGAWCPGKNELATIRHNIMRNPSRLRSIISSPDFVKYFGEAKPHPKGQIRNIFGREDELKNAPKGVAKDHKDIDLLKCRSFSVVYRFPDEDVLLPTFKEELCKVVRVCRPFVHCLNDMMTLPAGGDSDSDSEDGNEDEDGEAADSEGHSEE